MYKPEDKNFADVMSIDDASSMASRMYKPGDGAH